MAADELYPDLIKTHNKDPSNFFKNDNAAVQLEAYNPLCGDHFNIYFDVEKNHIRNVSFHGYGCAISKASSSILTEKLEGIGLNEVIHLFKSFEDCAVKGNDTEDDNFKPFQVASSFPGREECAILSWQSIYEYFEKNYTF